MSVALPEILIESPVLGILNMKIKCFALSIILTSTALNALDCGHLGITIVNASVHQCVLYAVRTINGYFIDWAPLTILSGTTSPTFYMNQDYYGVSVELNYRCDNKVVIFDSLQGFCDFMAGNIDGSSYIGNDLKTEHKEQLGSFWSSRPGQITWVIN